MKSNRQNGYIIREIREELTPDELVILKEQLGDTISRFDQFENSEELGLLSVDRIHYIAERQGHTELISVLENEQYNELLVKLFLA